MDQLAEVLRKHTHFAAVIENDKPFKRIDFSARNQDLLLRDLSDTRTFSNYVFETLLVNNTFVGIGGYNENRVIYRQKDHFTKQDNPRCIHLGTDIWTNAGETVYVPLDGELHSFAFNNHYGDYGPTIILRHELEGITFFTLYGHLSLDSLEGLHIGKKISAGQKLARFGAFPINGDWPPHLHFQIISDIGDYRGDFPGVASVRDQDYYLSICPDPNLILRIAENSSP